MTGMLRTGRAAVRLLALVGWTPVALLIVLAVHAVVALHARGVLRVPASYRWRDRAVSWWAKGIAAILGLRTTVEGDVPEPPFFLVSNHLSYVDIILLQHLTPCILVAKADVRSWPVVGFLAAAGGTLFIDREARRDVLRVNALMETALARGEGVVLFPEGTSTRGDRVLPFKPSLLAPLAASDRAIYFASLSYRTPEGAPPAATAVCWWGDMTFADHVWRLLQLPHIEARVAFGRYRPDGADRKALAAELTECVRRHFVPAGQGGGHGPAGKRDVVWGR